MCWLCSGLRLQPLKVDDDSGEANRRTAAVGRGCVKTRSSFFEPFKINQMATCALVSLADSVILIDHKHRILDFKRPNRLRDAQKI